MHGHIITQYSLHITCKCLVKHFLSQVSFHFPDRSSHPYKTHVFHVIMGVHLHLPETNDKFRSIQQEEPEYDD